MQSKILNIIKYLKVEKLIIIFCLKKKTNITSGEGSCAQAGTTDDKVFYCPNGAECNNFVGKSCWDPLSGKVASTLCKANEWQCKVCIVFMKYSQPSSVHTHVNTDG
jgi:hypothetical protein